MVYNRNNIKIINLIRATILKKIQTFYHNFDQDFFIKLLEKLKA